MSLKFRKMNVLDEEKHNSAYKGGMRAFVDITLNDTIQVNGFRVCDNGKGLWVSPPTQKSEMKGKTYYFPIFQFEKKEHNDGLAEDIIKKYKAVLQGETIHEKVESVY